jgi:hypothetical protein
MPRSALIVAHPGHELRVFRWVEREQPLVFVLTDGSGARGTPRVRATARLLEQLGAPRGEIFGVLRDVDAYALLMRRDATALFRLADRLASVIGAAECSVVAGDACEGYNPMHDVCRAVVDLVSTSLGIRDPARNLSIKLTGRPSGTRRALAVSLDTASLARKMAAARGYAELAAEVAEAEVRFGAGAFGCEFLEPTVAWAAPPFSGRPPYETYGEERVRRGLYPSVLRYREHVQPVVEALARHAGQ